MAALADARWSGPALAAPAAPVVFIVGTDTGLAGAARTVAGMWLAAHHGATVVTPPPAAEWPFRHPLVPALPEGPVLVWAPGLHDAAVNNQAEGTRLVTTQLPFLLETWRAAIGERSDVLLLATARRESLARHAPELLARTPPRGVQRIDADTAGDQAAPAPEPAHDEPVSAADTASGQVEGLARAFRLQDSAGRLALIVSLLDAGRTAAALVAAGSACMEVNDLEAAARDLDEALVLAPDWPAAWFERGKLWLRVDDMERAAGAFRRAVELLPGFVSAWGNLGAAEGELGRSAEARAAFKHAIACDPDNHHILNNLGVVSRELGRLADAEAAFRRVAALVPHLAVGHYNLGHTLFLQGRYKAAVSAYEAGQRRDSGRNPVQAMRLAMCRLAAGDAEGALADLGRLPRELPADYRRQLMEDAHQIAWALLTSQPDLPGWKPVHDWLAAELAAAGRA